MEAIILAGGRGTRLQAVVADVPKPLAPVAGQPFLSRQMDALAAQGVRDVILSVGYKRELIMGHYGGRYGDIRIRYCEEDSPLGTGGALRESLKMAQSEAVFVVNGDTFYGVSLIEMAEFHRAHRAQVTMALKPMRNFDRYGCVQVDGRSRVVIFQEKRPVQAGLINGGVYLVERSLRDRMPPEGPFSFESEFLERVLARIPIYGFCSEAYFIDIGIPEDYATFQARYS